MFKGTISNQAITANTNIPITVNTITNGNVIYDPTDNTIVFNKPGYYDLYITLQGTNFAGGTITLSEVLDGVPSTTAVSSYTSTGVANVNTFNIEDCIKVLSTYVGNKAKLSYRFNADGTVTSALILVEGRR